MKLLDDPATAVWCGAILIAFCLGGLVGARTAERTERFDPTCPTGTLRTETRDAIGQLERFTCTHPPELEAYDTTPAEAIDL